MPHKCPDCGKDYICNDPYPLCGHSIMEPAEEGKPFYMVCLECVDVD